jgi:hypothetical protein
MSVKIAVRLAFANERRREVGTAHGQLIPAAVNKVDVVASEVAGTLRHEAQQARWWDEYHSGSLC